MTGLFSHLFIRFSIRQNTNRLITTKHASNNYNYNYPTKSFIEYITRKKSVESCVVSMWNNFIFQQHF